LEEEEEEDGVVLVVAGHYCIVVASNSSIYLVWIDDDTLHLYCFAMQDDAEKADDGQEPAAALALAAEAVALSGGRVAVVACYHFVVAVALVVDCRMLRRVAAAA
jgi:hypothetical protein